MRRWNIHPSDCVRFCPRGAEIGKARFSNLKYRGMIALRLIPEIEATIRALATLRQETSRKAKETP